MKKVSVLLVVLMVFVLFSNVSFAQKHYDAKIVNYPIKADGVNQNLSFHKLNIAGTTYLSLRDLAGILGVRIDWDGKSRTIYVDTSLKNEGSSGRGSNLTGSVRATEVEFPIYIDSIRKYPEKLMVVVDGRTYLGLRDLSNMLNVPISWDYNNREVLISLKDKTSYQDNADAKREELKRQEEQRLAEAKKAEEEKKKAEEAKKKQEEAKKKENYYPTGSVNYLSDSKIKNMGFSKEELDYILNDRLTPYEQQLYDKMNEARAKEGLSPIKLSMELTKVARVHVLDAKKNNNYKDFKDGNLHSWSYSNNWKGGPYPDNHSNAQMMWDKPRELTNYSGNGYEISARGYATPADAIKGWEGSSGHNAVMKTKGQWKGLKVAGVGFGEENACIWFGKEDESYSSNNNYSTTPKKPQVNKPTQTETQNLDYTNFNIETRSGGTWVSGKNIDITDEMLSLVNDHRANHGLSPLQKMSDMQNYADIRAVEIAVDFSHTRPNGKSALDNVMGGNYRGAGENIAAGKPTAQGAFEQWVNSPGHNANMLNPDFTHMATGAFITDKDYKYYYVQLFGTGGYSGNTNTTNYGNTNYGNNYETTDSKEARIQRYPKLYVDVKENGEYVLIETSVDFNGDYDALSGTVTAINIFQSFDSLQRFVLEKRGTYIGSLDKLP